MFDTLIEYAYVYIAKLYSVQNPLMHIPMAYHCMLRYVL